MDGITPRCDFVFTGGEPLADLDALQQMLDAIPATHKIYINTTFPVQTRHTPPRKCWPSRSATGTRSPASTSPATCSTMWRRAPTRCWGRSPAPRASTACCTRTIPRQKLVDYVERFLPYRIPIQFRYDYTETTPENLYEEEHDKILQDLKRLFTYKGLDGCRMRNGFHFEYKGLHMTYHKTLPYSTIVETGDGRRDLRHSVRYPHQAERRDPLRLDRREDGRGRTTASVTFEPYDLRVLDGTIDF